MSVKDTPEWLTAYVDLWSTRLGLKPEWTIKIGLELVPGDDTEAEAYANRDGNLNFAYISFRVDIEEDRHWKVVVIHELYHVKHTRVDLAVRHIILPALDGEVRNMSDRAYSLSMESHTESMADILYDLVDGATVHGNS